MSIHLTRKEKAPVMRSQPPRFRTRRIGREPSEDVVRSKRRRGAPSRRDLGNAKLGGSPLRMYYGASAGEVIPAALNSVILN
ncbi:uncharacterized protein N7515_001396 [Penicillium bovifimosum]|uniref:Uncharacterized protein n=1 Tax=Penicillium bovifimosum TaxID=126998 RepID=A0A9W9H9S6_9EURO|nr:uncharacterized protein N7515_001396 [Penicillium bovifimosum]KAJ5142609.1 hypothetical protein N7515_001396 [Penicillium bovifimosum]